MLGLVLFRGGGIAVASMSAKIYSGSSTATAIAKRSAGQAGSRGAGVSPAVFRKRAGAATYDSTGGRMVGVTVKIGQMAAFSASAGFALAASEKLTNAAVFTAASRGGGAQYAGARRISISAARMAGGAGHAGALAKRTTLIGRAFAGTAGRALSARTSFATGSVSCEGHVFALGRKQVEARGWSSNGAALIAVGFKLSIGAAVTTGGAVQITVIAPPSLSDVVVIAGRWNIGAAINGIIAAPVSVVATREAIVLRAMTSDHRELDGRAAQAVTIKGTRKRT